MEFERYTVLVSEFDLHDPENNELGLGGGEIREVWVTEAGLRDRTSGPSVVFRHPETQEIVAQQWFVRGMLHRDGGPSEIIRTDTFHCDVWRRQGKMHRDDGPANVMSDARAPAVKLIEQWYHNGLFHREDGPAIIHRVDDSRENFRYLGRLHSESWCRFGKWHREGGPAEISYKYPTGELVGEAWYVEGQLHRLDGPAHISYDETTGRPDLHEYFVNGKLHRTDGPARIRFNVDTGKVIEAEYYVDGMPATPPTGPSPKVG
jgi:hypothetical protein